VTKCKVAGDKIVGQEIDQVLKVSEDPGEFTITKVLERLSLLSCDSRC
jgi:hypothetical protein